MPSQNGNGGQRGPWGSGAKSGSDLEDLVRQGQDQLKQLKGLSVDNLRVQSLSFWRV